MPGSLTGRCVSARASTVKALQMAADTDGRMVMVNSCNQLLHNTNDYANREIPQATRFGVVAE
jgi:hypothetical protein